MYRFRISLFTPNIFQLSSASCYLYCTCILQSPQFLGSLGHSSFARIIAKLASMWLATRTTNMDFYHTTLSRLSSHTHTLCDHPPERTPYYNWVGRFLPLRTAYHYWLVHRATLQPKNRQTQRMQGRGKGGKKRRPQMPCWR